MRLLMLLSMFALWGCQPSQAVPDASDRTPLQKTTGPSAPPQADVAFLPAPAAPSWGSVERVASGPGANEALMVEATSRAVVERVLKPRVPDVIFDANANIHLAINTGEIVAAYPTVPGEVDPKVREKALKRKRRLAPGELELFFSKTGETLKVRLYDAEGRMQPEAYAKLARLMTDPNAKRAVETPPWVAYHPRLFAILYYVAHHFNRRIYVVSAYRAPARSSRKRSFHVRGSAVDFRIDGQSRNNLLAYVEKSFTNVGVGWYPNSTFIHLDVRDRSYYWVDRSGPGQRQRTRKRKIRRKPKRGTDPTELTVHIHPNDLYKR